MKENRLKYPLETVHQCGEYYKAGHSLTETAEKFGVPYQWVKVNLLQYGYRQPSKKLSHQLHTPITYFSKIDSHNKAYLLGWMFSDGYVCKNPYGYTLGIALQTQDKYILEFIATELGLPISKISKYKNSYKLCVNERTVCEDLLKLGIEEDKSHKEIHIPKIPEEFYSSFIAGVFDGDGCVYNSKHSTSVHIYCNSKSFLEELQQILFKNTINAKVRQHKVNVYDLHVSSKKENISKFADFIYANREIRLKRKYDRFMKIPR